MGLLDTLFELLRGSAAAEDSGDGPPTGDGAPDGDPAADDSSGAASTSGATAASAIGDGPGDFRDHAEEFVDFWDGLDYSPDSLRRLDEVAAQQGEHANHLTVELDGGETVSFAPIATGMACYFGEVLVGSYDDAAWTRHERVGWAVEVEGSDGATTVNVFHVAHDCLDEEPKFAFTHDVVLEETGVAGESVAGAGGA